MRRDKNEKRLAPVRPNAGVEMAYRRKLEALIEEMAASALHWVRAEYRANPPLAAQDELPAAALRRMMRELANRWDQKFAALAPELAKYFAQSASKRNDAALQSILRKAGFTVKFKMTAAMRDKLNATIGANVALIKSIPEHYFTQIEGMVMRAVQAGRDVGGLAKEIESEFGVTKRRAQTIARSQNRLATAAMSRVRRLELGITEAEWMHSGGAKHPRPSHVKAGRDRQRYDVRRGWFDPHERKWIQPGELINCSCVSRPVLTGLR